MATSRLKFCAIFPDKQLKGETYFMCGIVGFTGDGADQAAPVLLDGLAKLEYRGYDSAGIAVYDDKAKAIHYKKTVGRLKVLYDQTHGGADLPGTCGIGHTRWATHGEPTQPNAHPHLNKDNTIAVVHNGIIENYLPWRKRLQAKGYEFKSDTDTEVIVQMIDYYYKGDPLKAITTVMQRLEGSYALGILFADHPGVIFAARKDSPLIVGKSGKASFIASDVPAILKYTRTVYYLDNEEVARLTPDNIEFFNIDEEPVEKEAKTIDWDINAAEKGGYEYFMLKEIYEEPKALRDTLNPRIRDGHVVIDELGLSDEDIRKIHKLFIVACGSAYHAGITGKYVLEGLARIPVEVDLASEFRYRDPIIEEGDYVIIISQSGETADSLAALRESKKRGAKTLGIINVVGSSIAREADNVMYTWAGPEIAVATTKAYQTQLMALYLLAIKFAVARGKITADEEASLISDLKAIPDQIQMQLSNKSDIQKFANRYLAAEHVFFIGRGIDYAISLEGSLKLKEISYIHSEAYAAGELKHGTISLIEDGRLVVAVMTQPELVKKEISNVVEVKSRGAFVMAVTTVGNTEVEKVADYVIYIPKTNRWFTNSLAIVPLQLFGYYVALGKGLDVDKPRNLAKSVTVE
jgi:glucosamine--fructose-6-phosphate aminotransferase (isomerizing)